MASNSDSSTETVIKPPNNMQQFIIPKKKEKEALSETKKLPKYLKLSVQLMLNTFHSLNGVPVQQLGAEYRNAFPQNPLDPKDYGYQDWGALIKSIEMREYVTPPFNKNSVLFLKGLEVKGMTFQHLGDQNWFLSKQNGTECKKIIRADESASTSKKNINAIPLPLTNLSQGPCTPTLNNVCQTLEIIPTSPHLESSLTTTLGLLSNTVLNLQKTVNKIESRMGSLEGRVSSSRSRSRSPAWKKNPSNRRHYSSRVSRRDFRSQSRPNSELDF